MQRWNTTDMLALGEKLFAKIYKRKHLAHHNHEIHTLARHQNEWLGSGIQSLIEGKYTPQHCKRLVLKDETIDQLHISDRILQHILLKQLKPTFSKVMNKNCYHLHGPTGVKYATQRIKQVLQDKQPHYFIRADIKSFYRSIPHFKLIQDVNKHYDDPKVRRMLCNIITNPTETPRGIRNPSTGIAVRGPLSQFFSALYLKPLDDSFDSMEVTYLRYQDDILILCKTKRQFNRCRRCLMAVLRERHLTLSPKKSRMGPIALGFHFLGIDYPATRTEDNTNRTQMTDGLIANKHACFITNGGG